MNRIDTVMSTVLGRSWRTTLTGFVVAVGNLILNGVSLKTALASAAIQTITLLMKDASTHSTVEEVTKATSVVDKQPI